MTSTKFIVILLFIAVNAICSKACSGGGSKPKPKQKAVPPRNCQCPKLIPSPVTTSKPIYSPAQDLKPFSYQPPAYNSNFGYKPPAYNPNFGYKPPAYNPNFGYKPPPAYTPNSGYKRPPAQNLNSGYNPLTSPGLSGKYPNHQYPSYSSNVLEFSAFHEKKKPNNPQPSNNEAGKSSVTPFAMGFGVINSQHNRTEEGWSTHTSSRKTW